MNVCIQSITIKVFKLFFFFYYLLYEKVNQKESSLVWAQKKISVKEMKSTYLSLSPATILNPIIVKMTPINPFIHIFFCT